MIVGQPAQLPQGGEGAAESLPLASLAPVGDVAGHDHMLHVAADERLTHALQIPVGVVPAADV
jgi:hypothetical protein